MRFVLCFVGLLVAFNGFMIGETAQTVMQQQIAAIQHLIGAVLFSAGCIMGAVVGSARITHQKLDENTKELRKHAEESS